MNVNTILQEQKDIKKKLQNEINRFHDEHDNKRVTRKSLENFKFIIQDLWDQFSKNDSILKENLVSEHDYFLQAVKEKVGKIYNDAWVAMTSVVFDKPAQEDKERRKNETIEDSNDKESNKKEDENRVENNSERESSNIEDTRENPNSLERLKLNIRQAELECELERLRAGNSQINRDTSFTRNLADVLFDIKKDLDDDVIEFNDDTSTWLQFRNMFEVSVHDKNIPKLQKFAILVKKVKGAKGKSILQGFTYAEKNYDAAWEALNKAFHNPAALIRLELRALQNAERDGNIRKVINRYNRFMANVEVIFKDVNNEKRHEIYFNSIMLFMIEKQLTESVKLAWGNVQKEINTVPNHHDLIEWLEKRSNAIEHYVEHQSGKNNAKPEPSKHVRSFIIQAGKKCNMCNGNHTLVECFKFKAMSQKERWEFVRNNKLCGICFKHPYDHTIKCRSGRSCSLCQGAHHELLHRDLKKKQVQSLKVASTETQGLTPTAVVVMQNADKRDVKLLALIDSGSDCNFITKEAVRKLGIKVEEKITRVSGIGNKQNISKGIVKLQLKPRWTSTDVCHVTALLIENIGDENTLGKKVFVNRGEIQGLRLANPQFFEKKKIDLLIGAPTFPKICMTNMLHINSETIAMGTRWGYIIFGATNQDRKKANMFHVRTYEEEIFKQRMEQFWEIEEENDKDEDDFCEKMFSESLKIVQGRYEVKIPFRPNMQVGESFRMALARLEGLKRKLEKNDKLKAAYTAGVEELLKLGHVEEIRLEKAKNLLPHNCVYKPSSVSTELRIVYDASAKTSNGLSINDCQYKGPKLQSDISVILLRFRQFQIAIAMDLEKMFKQISVKKEDADLQCILWKNAEGRLQIYRHTRVVFGMASSPYLANRCLLQVANEFEEEFPSAARKIRENCYVDDLIFSVETEEEGKKAITELKQALAKRCFPSKKWASNNEAVLSVLPKEDLLSEITKRKGLNFEGLKTLGLLFNPKTDTMSFKFSVDSKRQQTKREILSSIMQFYDPLGLLEPLKFTLKVMMQELWVAKIDWDDVIPEKIAKKWDQFQVELKEIERVKVNRHVHYSDDSQIIGFSDGSEKGYGAVVYLRTGGTKPKITLLAAKSRVAPQKTKQTIPRLELMGVVLLSELVETIKTAFKITDNERIIAFSDSQTVIGQIQMGEQHLKPFVANRVRKITQRLESHKFYYVNTKENSADLVSRGENPKDLVNNKLWWTGPEFLKQEHLNLKTEKFNTELDVRKKRQECFMVETSIGEHLLIKLTEKFSSWIKLRHTVVYCSTKRWKSKINGPIQVEELQKAEELLIKAWQGKYFYADIKSLEVGKRVKDKTLLNLNPVMINGIMRVGGRLKNSGLQDDAQHGIIIPAFEKPKEKEIFNQKGQLATLLIDHAHKQTLHGGIQQVLMYLRQRYWIIHAKTAVRYILKQCVMCARFGGKIEKQLMGDLPKTRVNQAHCFEITSIDCFGPINIKASLLRSIKVMKVWGLIFVCQVTRALHIEVLTNMTAECYIAALKRFVSRRGLPKLIYSDNGTNFKGGARLMQENYRTLIETLRNNEVQQEIIDWCTTQQIEFQFIPAHCAHVGGLHEAAVKSFKYHLKRIAGHSLFNLEELNTLLIQIEAILNSRPLTTIESNNNEYTILTAGHFLTGRMMLAVPEMAWGEKNLGTRWRIIEQQSQQFWHLWKNDYLHGLQTRNKWKTAQTNIKLGQIVLMKQDNTPKMMWNYAKVVKLRPDDDGIVRIVDIQRGHEGKKGGRIETKHIVKLCVLPVCDTNDQENASNNETNASLSLQENKMGPPTLRKREGWQAPPSSPNLGEDRKAATPSETAKETRDKKEGTKPVPVVTKDLPSAMPVKQKNFTPPKPKKKKGATIYPVNMSRYNLRPKPTVGQFTLMTVALMCLIMAIQGVKGRPIGNRHQDIPFTTSNFINHQLTQSWNANNKRDRLNEIKTDNEKTAQTIQGLKSEQRLKDHEAVETLREIIGEWVSEFYLPMEKMRSEQKWKRFGIIIPEEVKTLLDEDLMNPELLGPEISIENEEASGSPEEDFESSGYIDESSEQKPEKESRTEKRGIFLARNALQAVKNLETTVARGGKILKPKGKTNGILSPTVDKILKGGEVVQESNQKALSSKQEISTQRSNREIKEEAQPIIKALPENTLMVFKKRDVYNYKGKIWLHVQTGCSQEEDTETIQTISRNMSGICHRLAQQNLPEDYCWQFARSLKNLQEDIKKHIKNIVVEDQDENIREKRRTKGMLLTIFEWIFGGGEELQDIKETTAHLEEEMDHYQQKQAAVKQSEIVLRHSILKLNEQMAKANIDTLNFYNHLVYSTAVNALEAVKRKYHQLENPEYTQVEQQQIENLLIQHLPTNTKLPDVPIKKLLDLVKKEIVSKENKLVLRYEIPVVETEMYHEILLIATPDYNTSSILRVETPFLAYSEKTKTFFDMTQIREILSLDKNKVIIKGNKYTEETARKSCILQAFIQEKKQPLCTKEKLAQQEISKFIEVEPNQFVFYATKDIVGDIVCEHRRIKIQEKSGLLKVPGGCEIQTNEATIVIPFEENETINKKDQEQIYAIPINENQFVFKGDGEVQDYGPGLEDPSSETTTMAPARNTIESYAWTYAVIGIVWVIVLIITIAIILMIQRIRRFTPDQPADDPAGISENPVEGIEMRMRRSDDPWPRPIKQRTYSHKNQTFDDESSGNE